MKNLIAISFALVILSSCGKNTNEVSPQYKDITEMVFASGSLEPNDIYNLTAQSEGYIVKLNITEGDIVKSGDVLAIVDNKQSVFSDKSATELLSISQSNVSTNAPALIQAEANIALAAEKVKQDGLQVTRYKKLVESNSVSKVEYENVWKRNDIIDQAERPVTYNNVVFLTESIYQMVVSVPLHQLKF